MDLCAQSKEETLSSKILESERKAPDELLNNEDIVIPHANKGGAIVVQVKTACIQEIEQQLTDRDLYTLLNSEFTLKFGD